MLSALYKPALFCCLSIVLTTSSLHAQSPWTRVTPTPVEQSINDMVRIPGTERILAVADGSTVMTSDNQGQSWDISLHPANLQNEYRVNDIYFIDNQTGFIGGGGNSILKTTDGGETWSLKFVDGTLYSGYAASEISFMNDSLGFALGDFGELLKTTDRGETWIVADTFQWAYGFHKVNNLKAYINNQYPGNWIKTTDGGETWVTENIPFGNAGEYVTDIKFLNDSTAVASLSDFSSGENIIYRTTDDCETWTVVYTPSWDLTVNKFDFIDELHGIALCWSVQYQSSILITSDGGITWSEIENPIDWQNMNVTCYYDQNVLLAAGTNGFIYKSTDAGLTWNELSDRELGSEIFEVQFVNENVGFLTCYGLGGGVTSIDMNKTTDGGQTWSAFENPGLYPSAFYFMSETLGYLADGSEFFIFDNGEWETINTGFDFAANDIKFYNELTGIIAGEGRVIKTTDGGLTWSDITPLPSPGIIYNNIEYASPENIFLTSEDKVFRSSDGGWSWQLSSLSEYYNIYDLCLLNGDTAFIAAGDAILKSVDGTVTWIPCEINANGIFIAESVCFPTSATGYAAGFGQYDNIVKTTDGGLTWNSLTTISSAELSCVYFSDENNGMVFGDLGLVMKTETGGVVNAGNIPIAENNSNFFVNPNPFNREFRIGFNRQPIFPVDLSIADITGKTITHQQLKDSSETVISTDALKSGVYFLSVVYKDGSVETRKVIKL